MAHRTGDRIKETTTTTGTGALSLAGAATQHQAFSAVCSNGDTVYYSIVGQTGSEWEVGLGTWNTGNTLTRTTVLSSSNAGAAVNLSAGTKDVFCTIPAAPSGGGQAFPVGAIFTAVVSTNPATLLGYGTWSAFAAGRMLVGLDSGDAAFDTVEETGGAKTHTLSIGELPAHNHTVTDPTHSHTTDDPGHVHGMTGYPTATGANSHFTRDTSMSGTPTAVTLGTDAAVTGVTVDLASTNITIDNAGADQAHNNLPPYIVVYMWKRTA